MNFNKIFLFGKISILLFVLPIGVFSQTILTKAEAVQTTFEKNYGIKVAQNNIKVAENNTGIYNTGKLPVVNGQAGGRYDLGSSTQTFNTGNEIALNNATTLGANASVSADYTIFDETRTLNIERLNESRNLADIEMRQTMENSLTGLLEVYYETARLTQNLNLQTQTIDVSKRRLERASYRYKYGQGIRLDVLNAEVDLQRDSINMLNIRQQLSNSKHNLNFIMGRDVKIGFEVDTAVVYTQSLSLERLVEDAKNQNVNVLVLDKNIGLTQYDLQLVDAGKMPTVGANASYNYNITDNPDESFFTKTTSNGLSLGLTVNWNIFDGGFRRTRAQNTQVFIESQQIQREQLLQQLERDVANAWGLYQNAFFILKAEEKNLASNRLNFERTNERYKAGQVSSVEFRQAQLNLLRSETNYHTAKYDAKLRELQLLQLSGGLLAATY